MKSKRPVLISLVVLAAAQLASGGEPPTMTVEEAQQALLFAARPTYPYEARRMHISGSGIFELKFDYETGHLREIHVVKSTGNDVLDGHAIGALKLWKAKPRSIHSMRIPITFTYKRRG